MLRMSTACVWLLCAASTHAAVSPGAVPDATADGVAAVKKWATARVSDGERSFRGARKPSPAAWQSSIVYQIQVDRFNNGNISNDGLNLPPDQASGNQGGLPGWRHGGDIQGITDRLDYIKELGANTLWITPVFQHNGDYHGYCSTDLTKIDPGFGTPEELTSLISAAHEKDILVVLDIVVNHLCDRSTTYSTSVDHQQCAQGLHDNYWAGKAGSAGPQGNLSFSTQFFGPLHLQDFFNRCGANSGDDTSGTGPAAVFGDFTSSMFDYDTRNYDFQAIYTELLKYWVAAFDIDGFRMDAAKHITDDFIAFFSTEVRSYASGLGKDDFFVLGEVAAPADWEGRALGKMMSSPSDPDQRGNVPSALTTRMWQEKSTYLKHTAFPMVVGPGLNGVYEFAHSGTARDALLGNKPCSAIAQYFDSDGYRTVAAQADIKDCWTMLEIHDWPRFLTTKPDDAGAAMAGMAYLLTAQGIPIVYYGLEQGLNAHCIGGTAHITGADAQQQVHALCAAGSDDSLNRQDMFPTGPWRLGSAVPEVNALAYIGLPPGGQKTSKDWRSDKTIPTDHNLFRLTRKLAHLRVSCGALGLGVTQWRTAEDATLGLIAFSRVVQSAQSAEQGGAGAGAGASAEIMVIVNPGSSGRALSSFPLDATVNTVKGALYKNAFDPTQAGSVALQGSAASLTFMNVTVPAQSVVVMVQQGHLGQWDADLGVSLCTQ